MSACCVPGWIDDGDASRGELRVDGMAVDEQAVLSIRRQSVVYRGADGTVHDYVDEFRGLLSFRAAGRASSSSTATRTSVRTAKPGRARMTATTASPGTASSSTSGRTLEPFGPADPIAAGGRILTELLGELPSTLTCPGQACSPDAAPPRGGRRLRARRHRGTGPARWRAARLGPLCRLRGDRLPRSEPARVRHPGPGRPADDRDVALEGVGWLGRWLDAWADAGATRFVDFRELAGLLGVRVGLGVEGDVEVRAGGEVPPAASDSGWIKAGPRRRRDARRARTPSPGPRTAALSAPCDPPSSPPRRRTSPRSLRR